MSDPLHTLVGVATLFAIVAVIAYAIELWRRRGLRRWVREQGGTFEGAMLGGRPVPEGAPFDANYRDTHHNIYSNIARIVRPEASYVLASFLRSHRTMKNQGPKSSDMVCFVTPREGKLPDAIVALAAQSGLVANVQAHGGVVRLEARERYSHGQHQKLFEAARRWVTEAGRISRPPRDTRGLQLASSPGRVRSSSR